MTWRNLENSGFRKTTVKINISVFLLLNAVGMYLNTGHSMMYKAYAIKMSSLITSMKTI